LNSEIISSLQASHPSKKLCFNLDEGNGDDTDLLGIKGATLCGLYTMKLPVPPAFVVCTEFSCDYRLGKNISKEFLNELNSHVNDLENITGKSFGSIDGKIIF